MSFKILRNNITKVPADAIVNTANPMPAVGRGTDTDVYEAAGWEKLLAARKEIGVIERGQSAWTPAFNLKKHGVKYIIHTIGVFYQDGNHGEKEILRSCYKTALKTAAELNCKSVAIPLLATGNYRFPKDLALQIAVDEISRFLLEHEVDVLEKEITPIDVDAFIRSSKDKLNFQNNLLQLIADRKLDNVTVYKKACIDKKFFSKIISNKDYVPKKHTVMALGLALELPLEEYEAFLASAGYAFMPSSKFDLIIKYCVMNQIYNLINVDVILDDHGEECFAPV